MDGTALDPDTLSFSLPSSFGSSAPFWTSYDNLARRQKKKGHRRSGHQGPWLLNPQQSEVS